MPAKSQLAAALLAVWVLWGSTFLGIRVVVSEVPALFAAGLRFTLAGSILFSWVAWRARNRPGPGIGEQLRGRLPRFALLGVLHFLVANGIVSLAERHLESSTGAVCFATVPLWLLAIRSLTGIRPGAAELGAALLGLVGVALLLGFQAGPFLPSLMVLVAAAVWAAAGYLAGRPVRTDGPEPGTALTSAMQMVFGGLALLGAALVTGEWGQLSLSMLTPFVWLAGAHLVFLGSLVGFWGYTWLVVRVDQRIASTYAYVNPVVAVFLGWLFLDESLPSAALAGAALVTGTVAWTVIAQSTRRTAEPTTSEPSTSEGMTVESAS